MSGEKVEWRADDAEAGARRIAGRPAQAFWRRLRPCFRGVLLEPHRRAGDGRVSWSWTGPAEPGVPGGADLAGLRRRLGAGLANLAAELERDEEAGGGEAGELHAGMEALVADLTGAPDGRLAAYAARTEAGWMIRSWGLARPGPARRADEADAEPVAEAAEESAAIDTTEKVATGNATTGRRRLVWVFLILGALGAVAWGVWDRVAGRRDRNDAGQRETAIAAELVRSATSTGGIEPDRRPTPGMAAEGFSRDRSGPAIGPVFSEPGAPSRRTRENEAAETRLKVVPVPMAHTGPMATPTETDPKREGIESDPTRARSSTPPSSGPGASALKSPRGRPDQGADAAAGKKRSAVAEIPQPNASSVASRAMSLSAGEPMERVGEPTPQFEDRSARVGEISDAGPESASRSPEAPPGDEPAVEANGAEMVAAETTTTDAPATVDAAASPVSPAPVIATAPPRTWVCRLGEWRLARTRDVALATTPAEVAVEGDATEALAAARRRAWEQVRAALPSALRRPVTRAGWVFRFKTKSTDGKAAAAPTWVFSGEGERAARFSVVSGRAEIGWTEPASAGGIEARLVAPDGAEWARVRVGEAGRRIEVRAEAEVTEAAPWFEVLSGGAGEEPRAADACVWRSLRPGWADTRWRSERSSESTRVACFPADPALTISDEGMVALEHPPGGWALAREVRLDPGP